MADDLSLSVSKGPEWDATLNALTDESVSMGEDIRLRVNDVVAEWKTEVEVAVEAIPIKGVGKQTGLRLAVAHNVNSSTDGDGSHFETTVEADNPGAPDEAIIPLGLDQPTGWRHPVFGNKKTWVQQVPLTHFWFTAILNDDKRNNVSDEMTDAINDGLQRIADAGGA